MEAVLFSTAATPGEPRAESTARAGLSKGCEPVGLWPRDVPHTVLLWNGTQPQSPALL